MNDFPNPIERFRALYQRAVEAGIELASATALASVGGDGRPSVRVVLLKGVDERGFVFYTNLESRKARELAANPNAALCCWWTPLLSQVRIEGVVERVTSAEADAYFATRPRGSQLGAWASKQSEVLASRDELVAASRDYETEFEGRDVPRPEFWSGFRLLPESIEFWTGRPDRLHERELYMKTGDVWTVKLLYP